MHVKKVLLLGLAIVMALPSMGLAGEIQGVTDTTVTVGISGPASGPASVWSTVFQSAQAYAKYVNKQGGVHGRKIKVIFKDDGYNPSRTLANVQEMKNKIFAMVAVLGTASNTILKDFFPENKIPLVIPMCSPSIYAKQSKDKQKWVFMSWSGYIDEGRYLTNWAMKNRGAKKIAVFYLNDDYGKTMLEGVKEAVRHSSGKAKIVVTVPFEATERALATHAQKLKESGADTLIFAAIPAPAAILSKEIGKLGWKPNRYCFYPLSDPVMFKLAGKSWDGMIMTSNGMYSVPGTKEADAALAKIFEVDPALKKKSGPLAVMGLVAMAHFVKGLEMAGRNLTRESFIKGMEKIKDWRGDGVGAPVTYGPDRHQGSNAVQVCYGKDGKVVPFHPEKFETFPPMF